MQIHIIALLLFLQSFVPWQQGQENALPAPPDLVYQSGDSSKADSSRLNQHMSAPADLVYQSADGGETWQNVSAGLPADMQVQVFFATGSEIFLGYEEGLYRRNTSTSPAWQHELLLHGRITDVYPGRSGLFACSYGLGLFQNIFGTGIWKNMNNSLEDKSVRTVLETPDGTIFVGTDIGIYKSDDGSQTWKQVYADGLILNIVASGEVLIAGGIQGVLRSTDGGEHWDTVLYEYILAKKTGLIGDRFVTILGTNNPDKVSPEGITDRLRVSVDGGKTWKRLERTLLPIKGIYEMDESLSQIKDIYDIVQVGEYLFCSFDAGIFRSSDQGKTWKPVFPSNGKWSFQLAGSGKVIYAVKSGVGC